MTTRKKVLTVVLIFVVALTLVLPTLANPGNFIPAEHSTQITRDEYRQFGGVRHTANNSTRVIADNITFVADNNRNLLWYIHVTADIEGTIGVAYQISNRHFARTVNINGPGRYIIGNSRGQNGLNEIKFGSFVPAPVEPPVPVPVFVTFFVNFWGEFNPEVDLVNSIHLMSGEYIGGVPAAPLHPFDFEFLGWFLDYDSLDRPFDPSLPIMENTFVFGRWDFGGFLRSDLEAMARAYTMGYFVTNGSTTENQFYYFA